MKTIRKLCRRIAREETERHNRGPERKYVTPEAAAKRAAGGLKGKRGSRFGSINPE